MGELVIDFDYFDECLLSLVLVGLELLDDALLLVLFLTPLRNFIDELSMIQCV